MNRFIVRTQVKQALLTIFCLVLLTGCAAELLSNAGLDLIAAGKTEEGIAKLDEAAKADPGSYKYRAQAIRKREEIVNRLLVSADKERANGHSDEAKKLYERTLTFDRANKRALDGIDALARDERHPELVEQARVAYKKGDSDRALALLAIVSAGNPKDSDMRTLKRMIEEQQAKELLASPTLKSISKNPVSLEFRDANLKMVFEVLSRTSGINFILDKDVRSDLKTTLFLKQSSLEDAVDLMLATNQLEKKILNQSSVLIYPNTPAKIKEYQDLIMKSFYLVNADVKQTQDMIKTMLKTKDIFINEKLNLLIMRDSPEAIHLAEKLIAMHDIAEPEVMLEVEVLEIARSSLLNLGIQFPNQLTLAPLPSNGTILTLDDLRRGGGGYSAVLPNTIINMQKDDGDINILANPRIRVRNREKAKILIGDKVPVITTTTTATGFAAESVQYLDVGLKLEVEPNIYLQDDIAIRVALEVSSIVQQIKSSSGTLTYQIGTRNVSTLLQLKNGETQVLAGLISDEDRKTANKIPGLGDLPILGHLFSSHRDDNKKTEIVLSITPHLIRTVKRPQALNEEIWSGTEATLRTKPLTAQSITVPDVALVAAASTAPLTPASNSTVSNATSSSEEGAVNLSWKGPSQVKVGDQFTVMLHMKSERNVRSLPFQVGFDPKVMQIVDVAEGGFFRQGQAKSNFTSNVDQAGGKVFVGVARTGTEGAKGEESVAVLTFKTIASNSHTEVKLLAATPVGTNNATATPTLPAPYKITIN